jgi:hypothetical protein
VLLHKAAQDEAPLQRLLPHADLDDELIGFHAQQAVEKLLKAWLAHLGVDYPRTHSLGTLVEILGAHDCTLVVRDYFDGGTPGASPTDQRLSSWPLDPSRVARPFGVHADRASRRQSAGVPRRTEV